MDIKTMLEEIAPEVDESAAHDQVMALVRRRRRGVWVARVAAVAAVVAGFMAVAAVTGGSDPVAPSDGSSTSTSSTPPTTVAPTVSAAPPTTTPLPTTAPSSTNVTPSTTVSPTTTVPSTTIPIVEPTVVTYEQLLEASVIVQESTAQGPISPMGSDDGDGSGCTPGITDSLPDGLWYVHDLNGSVIDGVGYVQFDLVCRYSDDERQAIYTPDEVDYDTSVRNDSNLLRTLPMAQDAIAFSLGEDVTWELWENAPSFALIHADFVNWSWLKVVDGEIVEVFQQFEA